MAATVLALRQLPAEVRGYNVISVNSSPYTITPIIGEYFYEVDATSGNITINFPTAVGNTAKYHIKKIDSSSNTVILDPNGSETIDGQATLTILFQNTTVSLISDNSNLKRI